MDVGQLGTVRLPYSAVMLQVVMGLSIVFFLWQQNRWSWHLVGAAANPLDGALPQAQPRGVLAWDWHLRPSAGPTSSAVQKLSSRSISTAAEARLHDGALGTSLSNE